MGRVFLALTLLLPGVVLFPVMARAAERNIVVPRDTKPFSVTADDLVRLTGKGIAGARIEATVEGPAKIVETANIMERVDGHILIGTHVKEFELKATGKGKVKVQISVTGPQPGSKPAVTDYEYEIK